MKIAIDLMGGDNAPEEIILGCKKYIEKYPEDSFLLYGTKELSGNAILKEITDLSDSKFFISDSYVNMDESPLVIKKDKMDSTIVMAMGSHKQHNSDCVFSCGNSGAAILSAIDTIGIKDKQQNVALMSFIPVFQRDPVGIIDVGALGNRTFTAETYLEVTKLALDFYQKFFRNIDPVVKLLNIGNEPWKGTKEHKALYNILENTLSNFQGNIEGDGILKGNSDIVVTDGFTGNVVLKLIESVYDLFIKDLDKTHCKKSNNFLNFLVEEFNYESLGGAPLLGVKGKVVLGHGKSSSKAVLSGLIFCRKYSQIN